MLIKIVIFTALLMIAFMARADTYVMTPQGLVVLQSAGGKDLLINNPNGSLTLCTGSGSTYICGE